MSGSVADPAFLQRVEPDAAPFLHLGQPLTLCLRCGVLFHRDGRLHPSDPLNDPD